LACPLTSLLSYFFLSHTLNLNETSQDYILFWVGILLIISAGSFLYVATLHILPEVLSKDGHSHHIGHPHKEDESLIEKISEPSNSKIIEMSIMIVGLIAPLGLTFLEDA
jgi:solute carrier family 39 (zinc transporter), member 9